MLTALTHRGVAPAQADLTNPNISGASLRFQNVSKLFYAVPALSRVSFDIRPGEIVGLIGPNGSGKTTAVDCITGILRPEHGAIIYDEHRIDGLAPHRLARLGISRTFQGVRTFETMTVLRNLRVAALAVHTGVFDIRALLKRESSTEAVDDLAHQVMGVFGLTDFAEQLAGSLSYGQRKIVEFAAAWMLSPRLLLLDEPAAAVNPTIVNRMAEWITMLHATGTTIILVEHNIDFVLSTCERLIVLDHGTLVADGLPSVVIHDTAVRDAYFGKG